MLLQERGQRENEAFHMIDAFMIYYEDLRKVQCLRRATSDRKHTGEKEKKRLERESTKYKKKKVSFFEFKHQCSHAILLHHCVQAEYSQRMAQAALLADALDRDPRVAACHAHHANIKLRAKQRFGLAVD